MKLNFEEHGLVAIASLSGELNHESVDAFRRGVGDRLEQGTRDFVIVLDDLSQIDSAGLETLLWLQDRSADRNGQVRLVGLNDTLNSILRITRLEREFEQYADVTKAVRSLR